MTGIKNSVPPIVIKIEELNVVVIFDENTAGFIKRDE
jgi:hypothetical protein